ncbi:MAG: PAS domain S-box protein [Deltaproteobacteria bacterium]|nr:PAS domain S-box protein [Deltaproteobacteria bacterium]
MNLRDLIKNFFSIRLWPLYLFLIITVLAEFFNAILNIIITLIWRGQVDLDFLIIGSINAFIVTCLIVPMITYLIIHFYNLEDVNRHLRSEIEERARTDEALRQNEKMLRMISDNSRDVIWMTDMNIHFTFCSPAVEQVLGYTAEEYIKGKLQDYVTSASMEFILKTFAEEISIEESTNKDFQRKRTIEIEMIRKDGQIIWIEVNMTFMRDTDGKPIGILGFSRDITEQKRDKDALKESEEKYRLLFENINDVVYSLDNNFNVVSVSPSVEKHLGYHPDELIGMNIEQQAIFPQEMFEKSLKRVERYLRGESLPPEEYKVVAKDGTIKDAEIGGSPIIREGKIIGFMSVGRDITAHKEAEAERARLEQKLNQVQKLEAIGTLAGGIAHDFNNLLMSIQGFASLMLMEIDPGHPHYEKLKNIESQIHNGADLTRQLLGFARGGRYEVRTVDLNEIIKKTSHMFGRTKKEISIHFNKHDDQLWPVEVDQGQIEQVLLNLYVNAWQAMPAGGDLFLETRNVRLDEVYTRGHDITPGNYVKFSITDTGTGMDDKTKSRIFEPFFTTKEMGRGTGLGLAMVYGIIKGHKGAINVYSEKGNGTTFNIYLPASEKKLTAIKESHGKIEKGHETILLVDDEEMILNVTEKLLKNLGYQVITAKGGEEAIEIYRRKKFGIHLVVLDMIMPGMNGGETFDRLKGINPHIKVILSSGYSLNNQAADILKKGCRDFIQKPFNIEDLSQSIRAVLER